MLEKLNLHQPKRVSRAIKAYAEQRGYTYSAKDEPRLADVPIHGSPSRSDIVEAPGAPLVQFGNDGEKHWVTESGLRPGRRGYVRIEHGLDLPHLFATSSNFGALTAKNVVMTTGAVGFGLLGAVPTTEQSTSDYADPRTVFMKTAVKLELPKRSGFSAHVPEADTEWGQALMTPEAIELMGWLARSFDVEVFDGSLWAFSNYGDITTEDEDVWAWAYSVASRLIDLARVWGRHSEPSQVWPDYTHERVERPERLDGALSFLRRPRR